jgi:RNA polymerase sigma-70 factor (ECF subfamily)
VGEPFDDRMRILKDGVPHNPDIVAEARAGSTDALGRLFVEHADALLRVATRLTASAADGEDIVQDVFVGLPEALRRYEERGNFAAWLKRVTVRYALMHMRRDVRRAETSLEDAPEPFAEVRDHAAHSDIARGLAELSPALRAVFVLHEVEGYSHIEIGELLDIRAGTSEVRLFRARAALRTLLED